MQSNSASPLISKSQTKLLRQLKQKKYRYKYSNFICEGIKICNELIQERPDLVKLVILSSALDHNYQLDWLRVKDKMVSMDAKIFNQMSSLEQQDGVTVIADFPEFDHTSWAVQDATFYLDAIQDPGNLGTIIRIADWYGIRKLFLGPGCVDPFNSKVVQSSMGSVWRVDCAFSEFQEISSDFEVMVASMEGKPNVRWEMDKPCLLVLGNESKGVSDMIKEGADHVIRINGMSLGAESLNVSVSAGILMDRISQLKKPNS